MNRYAIIESNSGFVWGIVNATSALEACYEVDRTIGRPEEGTYEIANAADRDVYDVRLAPSGFDQKSTGDDEASITEVGALPRVDRFVWVPSTHTA